MSAHRAIGWLCAVALLGVVLLAPATADPPAYRVIVHPDNPVTSIDGIFLRDVYLKKANRWQSGVTVRPLDLAAGFAVRGLFTREVLRKTLPQLRNYWNQRIFSGKGVPPPQADSPAAAIAYVTANPGAVAYIPANVDPGRTKVIEVR